ncbi:hypothetical protein F0365_01850 [Nonlabens sp. Ci31]|jgi:uncharacterized membrane protein|uniref:hypothetical protein n=1 Tax=Nonlabens sp. Ci31 TaxID=2608253 RepID=UPI001463EDF3|nr:hypothetical protein [Nonlabens sp. Ci31]QJP33241.1 hypothetical protein F0365_01850 [Nonlabens sp. Ci31]
MASIKDLKQDINFVLGDIIEAALISQAVNPEKTAESEKIVDDSIATFDELISRVNNRKVESRKTHLKAVKADLETKGKGLIDRVNAL